MTALVVAAGGLINAVGFAQIAGDTPAARAVFAQQMELLARQLTYLLPAPAQLDTMAGYLTWRWFGSAVLIYAFWALLAGTGAGRGDEERGLSELWLSTGASRMRLIVARVAGFATVAAVSIAVMLAVTDVGAAIGQETLPLGQLALEGLAMWILTLFVFAFALVVAQLVTTRRGATGIAGVVVLALFMLNAAARSGVGVGAIRWLSPFYLFDRSTPLLRGGALDVTATAALAVGSLVLVGLAVVAFIRRDIGGPLLRGAPRKTRVEWRPAGDPLLRTPVLAIVDQQRIWIVASAVVVAVSSVAAYLPASSTGISLPGGRFVLASAAVLPVSYAFSGIGHALVGWRPRVAVAVLGTIAVVGYFAQQLGPLFQWPDRVNNISLYALYGTPMSKDDWSGIATLIAIGTAGTIVALVVMRRRDVGR